MPRDIIAERAAPDLAEENMALKRRELEMRCKLQQLEVRLRCTREDPWQEGPEGLLGTGGQLQRALAASFAGPAPGQRQAPPPPGTHRGAPRGRRQQPQRRSPGTGGRLRARLDLAPPAVEERPKALPHQLQRSVVPSRSVSPQANTAAASPRLPGPLAGSRPPTPPPPAVAQRAPSPEERGRSPAASPSAAPASWGAGSQPCSFGASLPRSAPWPSGAVQHSPPPGGSEVRASSPYVPVALPAPAPLPAVALPELPKLPALQPLALPPTSFEGSSLPPPPGPPTSTPTPAARLLEDLRRENAELSERLDELLVGRFSQVSANVKSKEKAKDVKAKESQIRSLEEAIDRQRDRSRRTHESLRFDLQRLREEVAVVKNDIYHSSFLAGSQADVTPLRVRLAEAQSACAFLTQQIRDLTVRAFCSTEDQRMISETRLQDVEQAVRKKEEQCNAIIAEHQRVVGETEEAHRGRAELDQQCRALWEENERMKVRLDEKMEAARRAEEQLSGVLELLSEEDRKVMRFSLQFLRERATTGAATAPATAETPAGQVAEMTHTVDGLRAEKDELAMELQTLQEIVRREREISQDLEKMHTRDIEELGKQLETGDAELGRLRRLAAIRDKRIQELREQLALIRKRAEPRALPGSPAAMFFSDTVSESGFSGLSEVESGNAIDLYLTVGHVDERALHELPMQQGSGALPPPHSLVTMVLVEFLHFDIVSTEAASGLHPRYDSLLSFGPLDVSDPVLGHFVRGSMRLELQAFCHGSMASSYLLGRASFPLSLLLRATEQAPNPMLAGTLSFTSQTDSRLQIATVQYKARWRKPIFPQLQAYQHRYGGAAGAAPTA